MLGDVEMEFTSLNLSGASEGERPSNEQLRIEIQWAEFALLKRTMTWLLILLTVDTVTVLVATILVARGQLGLATIGIGTLIAGNLTCVGRLLNNSLKHISRPKD